MTVKKNSFSRPVELMIPLMKTRHSTEGGSDILEHFTQDA